MRNFSKENAGKPTPGFLSQRASTSLKRPLKNGKKAKEEWIKVGTYKYR
jgi:hypothetical protein